MNIRNFSDIKSLFLNNKSIKQTIFKNTFWLTVTQGINKLLRFFLVIYAARILRAVEYGKFSFALNLVSILVIFADLGIETIIIREFSKNIEKEKEIFPAVLSLKTILSLIAFLIMFGTSFFVTSEPSVQRTIWILSISILLDHFCTIICAVFRSHQKMEYEAMGKILKSIFCVSLGFFFLFKFPSIINLSYAYLISDVFTLLLIFLIYQYKFYSIRFSFNKTIWKNILSLSWPLALVGVFTLIYHLIDSVMLGTFGMMQENGWYNAAYRIIDTLVSPMFLISASFFPVLSKSFREKEIQKIEKVFLSQLSTLTILAIPLVTGGIVLSPQIINFLYGNEYQPAILAFQILLVPTGLNFINRTFIDSLIAADLQKQVMEITFAGAILNVILNFVLIPKYTLYGAAVATLITYLLVFLLCLIVLKAKTSLSPFNKNYVKNLIMSILSAFLMCFIITRPLILQLNIILIILIGIIFYFIFIYSFKKYEKLHR